MGNSQYAIPMSLSHEWAEIGWPGEKFIHNIISQENFVLYKLVKNEALDTRAYVQRSIYALPHTPRLIIIDDTSDHFYFLVQAPESNFKYFARRKKLLIEALLLLKDLTSTARQLRQKYGGFEVQENMIGVLRNEEAILWIHQNYHCNSPQFPLADSSRDQEIMIKSLLSICQQHLKVNLSFILNQIAGALTFQIFLKHLCIKIEIQKFRLAQKSISKTFPSRLNYPTKSEDPNYSKKELFLINTNLKIFDKASITTKPSNFLHKRAYTDFQIAKQRNQSQSKTPQKDKSPSPTPAVINPNSAAVKSIINSQKPFLTNKKQILAVSSIKIAQKASTPQKIGHYRGNNGSLQLSEISFSQKARRMDYPNPTQRRDWRFKQQDKNFVTGSSEEGRQQQFQQRKERRQSTIKCIQDELWCERSIQEDYKCLFVKSNYQKKPYFNSDSVRTQHST